MLSRLHETENYAETEGWPSGSVKNGQSENLGRIVDCRIGVSQPLGRQQILDLAFEKSLRGEARELQQVSKDWPGRWREGCFVDIHLD